MAYPIGIQTFSEIIENRCVYVDKTAHVYNMTRPGSKYLFLGRPRRFGKSLMLSTLEAYFLGRKELFRGLAIEQMEKDWIKYPVLRLDFNTGKYDSVEALRDEFHRHLEQWEAIFGDTYSDRKSSERFLQVIELAHEKTGKQVVVLVDEYDKPLLQNLNRQDLQDELKAELKSFYSVLKTQDRHIRFAFLTGVTKFGKVSVFSDLNNLKDISMDERYADICGITEREMHSLFDGEIEKLAKKNGISFEQACQKLKETYNGYHFCPGAEGVYNPFSLLNALDSKRLGDYWFETGTPTFLVNLLRDSDYDLNNLQGGEAEATELSGVNSIEGNPIPLIYQSGYLTIKGYDERFERYVLGFPNKEVENGFIRQLLPMYSQDKKSNTIFDVKKFVSDVEKGDPENFMIRLQTFFEDADYRIAGKKEIYFQNVMFVIFKMVGFYTMVERATARGRVDVVLKTKDYIYVIECKLDGSVNDALNQIEERGYAKPFTMDPRRLFKIGINFSSEIRGIAEWKIVM